MNAVRKQNRFILLFSLASLFLVTGCIQKTVYPEVMMTVKTVTPSSITATFTTDASGTITLSPAPDPLSITFQVETVVPSRIVCYSIFYESRIGEALPELTILDMPYDLYLAPASDGPVETTTEIEVYSLQAATLLINTPSDIAPLRATVSFRIKDVNGNEIVREAHTQLSKPSSEATTTTTTTTTE